MPELPEVETVRRGLQPSLEGARLARVRVNRPDLRFPFPEGFTARLEGARVEALERRAKYLLARLDRGETWVTHLGMTGRFVVQQGLNARSLGEFVTDASTDEKHAHLVIETDGGARVTFFDARRFGYMGLMPTAELPDHPWFKGLGPEPLGPEFGAAQLAAAFKGRKQNVKATLLDQRVVAGLGNIYVVEALHRARISPNRAAGKVGKPALDRLAEAVPEVLEAAIAAGGSTLRDFAQADGSLGYFQHSFSVYGREGEACPRDDGGIVRRIVQAGRSTFFCPRCQR
jgi:formamidopyrimidine-DNA glycosylase